MSFAKVIYLKVDKITKFLYIFKTIYEFVKCELKMLLNICYFSLKIATINCYMVTIYGLYEYQLLYQKL